MKQEKRNQWLLIGTIIFLLLSVFIISILLSLKESNKEAEAKMIFKQIYSSDYELHNLGDDVFFGTYDNLINVFIDKNGKEIYKSAYDISYTDYKKVEKDSYLIYNANDAFLESYLFDGKTIKYLYTIEDTPNIKPILYKKENTEYLIAFVSFRENNLVLYSPLTGKKTELESYTFLGDVYQENIYYNNTSNYLVMKNNKEQVGVIDLEGNIVIDFQYQKIKGTTNGTFIAENKNGKYGILSNTGEVLLDFNYQGIVSYEDYYVVINNKNKMALYDKDLISKSGFIMDYNTTITFDINSHANSIDCFRIDNKIFVANNKYEEQENRNYKFHILYVFESDKLIEKIEQNSYLASSILLYHKKDTPYKIYDREENTIFLENILEIKKSTLFKDYLYMEYMTTDKEEKAIIYNLEQNTKMESEILIYYTLDYFVFLNDAENTISIKDASLKTINQISGSKIQINKDYLIIDQAIYHMEYKIE